MAKHLFGHWLRGLLVVAMLTAGGGVLADKNWRAAGTSRAAVEGGQCVRPTQWMRRNHMALIKHDRDVTVHQGVRDVDGSLSACIGCHANKDVDGHYKPVSEPGQFCAGCHDYTGTSLDCFSCHSTVPTQ